MVNYSMQKGRKLNDLKKLVTRILIIIALIIGIVYFLKWSDKQTDALMAIDYCWDLNGQHYVAPNENCAIRLGDNR